MTTTVVLVALDYLRDKDPRRSLGHSSILAQLALCPDITVIPVEFAVNSPNFSRRSALDAILRAVVDDNTFVAIGAYIWNEPVVQWLLPELRRTGFRGRLVLGGPQISYASAGIDLIYPDADAFVRGYGEIAMVELLRGATTVRGVTWRGNDDAQTRAEVNLALLPSPYLNGVLPTTDFVRWETQRGCPYSCSFCQHMESGAKLPHRKFATERIQAEIQLFVAREVKDLAMLDPVFNHDPEHAVRVLRQFSAAGYLGRLALQCRFESVTPEFLDACQRLNVCLEFGLQTLQSAEMKAIRRVNKIATVDSVITELHRRRIHFEVSLIYGLPEQTLESFKENVAWCVERRIPVIRAFPLLLLRGTHLDQERARWELVENNDTIPLVVESNTFSRLDWEAMREVADDLAAAERRVVDQHSPGSPPPHEPDSM